MKTISVILIVIMSSLVHAADGWPEYIPLGSCEVESKDEGMSGTLKFYTQDMNRHKPAPGFIGVIVKYGGKTEDIGAYGAFYQFLPERKGVKIEYNAKESIEIPFGKDQRVEFNGQYAICNLSATGHDPSAR